MGKRSMLPPGKRAELVVRLLSKEEPAVQIARRAGISEQTLYRWCDEFLGGGKQALAGRGADKELSELKSALAERDRVIGELTIANRVLKKCMVRPRDASPRSGLEGTELRQWFRPQVRGSVILLSPRAVMEMRACRSSILSRPLSGRFFCQVAGMPLTRLRHPLQAPALTRWDS